VRNSLCTVLEQKPSLIWASCTSHFYGNLRLVIIVQEVVVQGQDKVYKDVIEPLESASINTIAINKEDIRELGPPDKVHSSQNITSISASSSSRKKPPF
jgi:signal recognition particle receptor subunit beta